MAKLGNESAKAELGRATWKFLHTMTLRFPDEPSASDREALLSFFHLFSRLYPCGECAEHFQQLLRDLPPQTSSRLAAAGWLCAAHNRVNARLGKAEFPCDKLDETYDCGCGAPKKTSKVPPTLIHPGKADAKANHSQASEDWGEGGKDYVPHRGGRPLGG
ncbi:thiol oxidase [Ceraceosorus bombacis]|uniref:Sulfhydryl oxidase n=1 Tax=Ceraceosorus bombacis TaxID=401625 RepID=A0A0N7LBJ7_9BASI|nr:thiol oxidase [Ceraceosorus bombacis]